MAPQQTVAVRRRALVNLLLAALVLALALLLVLTGPQPREEKQPSLTGISPAQVAHIRIERADADSIDFERDTSGWRLTAPVTARAHPARINGVLGLLGEEVYARFPAAPDALRRFGLSQPQVIVRLDQHRFAFGDINPLDEHRYVLYGDTVHLIGDSLFFQLTQDPGFFIDNRLLEDAVRPRRVRYAERTLTFTDGSWKSEPESGLGADTVRNSALAWETARAITVRTFDDRPTTASVGIDTEQGETITFDIVETAPAVVLARRDLGIQYHLDAHTAKQLLLLQPGKTGAGPDTAGADSSTHQ
ncbi:MAG: DUF4340 domain-containing protein [Burkholderiales bacterium]